MSSPRHTLKLHGLVGLGVILAVVATCLGFYTHAFSRSAGVVLEAPKAGLLLAPGADVKLRGISVGRVESVRSSGGGARVQLALDPDQTRLIPADVTARIAPTTVVGAPHVELVTAGSGAGEASRPIRSGATIQAAETVPGINDLFQETVSLLRAVPVDDLNVTLSALASALDGRGERLGETLSELNDYVRTINEHRGALSNDIDLTAAVSENYADIAQPLTDVLRHSTVTGRTLVVRQGDLRALLVAADRLAATGTPFLRALRVPLTTAMRLLDPVTALLARYSPEYPCVLKALSNQALGNKSLGVKYPGAQAIMTLLPGQKGYEYPRDLPQFVDDRGPRCYSLPAKTAPYPLPYRRFNDNSHANQGDGRTKVSGEPVEFFGSTQSPPPGPPAPPSVGAVP